MKNKTKAFEKIEISKNQEEREIYQVCRNTRAIIITYVFSTVFDSPI